MFINSHFKEDFLNDKKDVENWVKIIIFLFLFIALHFVFCFLMVHSIDMVNDYKMKTFE